MIGLCIDHLEGLPQSARTHLLELIDPKRQVLAHEVEGLLKFEQAVQMVSSGDEHPKANSILSLITLIETHKSLQEKQMEGSFTKMEEALTAKKQLFDEIGDFELKQRTALNITTTVIIIVFVVFCFSCLYYRKKKPNVGNEVKKEVINEPWLITGNEAERKLKKEKMEKLEDTLTRMDDELVRLRKELEDLKRK